ncbi:MAG: hypothetical protein ACXWC8_00200 [Limisphaerales bacterium]
MRTQGALLLFCCAVMSSSALPDYEPFDYSAGVNLIGNTNANGLVWTAAGPAGAQVTVTSGNLNVFNLSPSTGNSVQINAATGPCARLGTEFTITSGTFMYSFAFRVANLAGLSTTGGYLAGFNNSRGTQSGTPGVAGCQLLLRSVDANNFNIGLSKASTTAADQVWSSQTFTTNDTIFVVGSYAFNSGNTSDDIAKLWINPGPDDFGSTNPISTPLVASTGTDISANQIASFVFFQRTGGVQPTLTLTDELRLGRTFADVTPTNATSQSCTYPVCPGGRAIVQCLEFTNRSYDIYIPPQYSDTGPALPILYTFHPDGNGMVSQFGGVASELGMIVVGIRESSNLVDWNDFVDVVYAATRDIRKRLRFDPTAEFTTGWSGGGYEAYMHSQILRQEISGVYPMGSWLPDYDSTYRYSSNLIVARADAVNDNPGILADWGPNGTYMNQHGIQHYDTSYPGTHAVAPDTNKLDCLTWLLNHHTPAGTNDEALAATQAASWRSGLTNGDAQRVFSEAFNTVMTNPRSYLENQAQLIVDQVMTNYETFRTFNITNLARGDYTADYLYFRAHGAAKIGDTNTYYSCLKAWTWLDGDSGDREFDIENVMSTYNVPAPRFTFTFTHYTPTFTYRKDVPYVFYTLQQSTTLTNNSWTNLLNLEIENPDGTFTQSISNDGSAAKFFRMALQ